MKNPTIIFPILTTIVCIAAPYVIVTKTTGAAMGVMLALYGCGGLLIAAAAWFLWLFLFL